MISLVLAALLGGGLPAPAQHCVTGVMNDPRLWPRVVWLYDVRRCEEYEPVCVNTAHHFCRPISVTIGTWPTAPEWDGTVPTSYPSPGSPP